MPQESIIDSIKKNIVFKKTFRAKKRKEFSFDDIIQISQVLFNKKITSEMYLSEFNYKFLNKNRETKIVKYKIDLFDDENGRLKISRLADEGIYRTSLELSKIKRKFIILKASIWMSLPFKFEGK